MVASRRHIDIAKKNLTRRQPPALPFLSEIKNSILGPNYHLSLVFMADDKARTLNRAYRNKTTASNVLSFPLDKTSGEIFINLKRAKSECKKFDMSYRVFVAYLFIHGLLHLKGYAHGSRMKSKEKQILNSYFT